MLRYMLVTGDGAYGEGPFYYRYTARTCVPYARAVGALPRHRPWTTEAGRRRRPSPTTAAASPAPSAGCSTRPSPTATWRPSTTATPAGPTYFGALPASCPTTAAGYWRWADDAAALRHRRHRRPRAGRHRRLRRRRSRPRAPGWSPTQVYVEGGTASSAPAGTADAVMALVAGRARHRLGVRPRPRPAPAAAPQSHEHPDPGSFMLYAYGERLALDPGYLTFATHGQVNQPEHHNMVLVDGEGPADYLRGVVRLAGRPARPAAGRGAVDASPARSTAAWPTPPPSPPTTATPTLDRRFLFADDRYLVVADAVAGDDGSATPHELTWMLHGNGGGTAAARFSRPSRRAAGGTIGGARLDAPWWRRPAGPPAVTTADHPRGRLPAGAHPHRPAARRPRRRQPRPSSCSTRRRRCGAADLRRPRPARRGGRDARRRAGGPPGGRRPHAGRRGTRRGGPHDAAGPRRRRRAMPPPTAHAAGRRPTSTAGCGWRGPTGPPRLTVGGRPVLAGADRPVARPAPRRRPGRPRGGARRRAGRAVAAGPDAKVTVAAWASCRAGSTGRAGSPCSAGGGRPVEAPVHRDAPATLCASGGNGRPRRRRRRRPPGAAPAATVTLDGRASCDPDGDALTPRWELVSAPAGSAWPLDRRRPLAAPPRRRPGRPLPGAAHGHRRRTAR